MKKLIATTSLVLLLAACTQTNATPGGGTMQQGGMQQSGMMSDGMMKQCPMMQNMESMQKAMKKNCQKMA
ncbi:MAG: hypothetical protein KGI29_10355, partial [Pseudomonadota bacterium]|nr:hypothetical protein [Pseudomonadota bacterium]